jgi:dUTP pyrophosphatase
MTTFYQLKVFIKNNVLQEKYIEKVLEHNNEINSRHPNAGFDLFCPLYYELYKNKLFKLNTEIICAMFDPSCIPCGYYLYPRSSISKTPLRLANSVGIIDSGYRGDIIGMFDVQEDYSIEQYTRLLQICSPTLQPIHVTIVNNIEELETTARGSGGFGSTGI